MILQMDSGRTRYLAGNLPIGHGKGLEQPAHLGVFVLGLLANGTLLDKVFYSYFHPFPTE